MNAAYFAISLAIAVSRKNTGIGVMIIIQWAQIKTGNYLSMEIQHLENLTFLNDKRGAYP